MIDLLCQGRNVPGLDIPVAGTKPEYLSGTSGEKGQRQTSLTRIKRLVIMGVCFAFHATILFAVTPFPVSRKNAVIEFSLMELAPAPAKQSPLPSPPVPSAEKRQPEDTYPVTRAARKTPASLQAAKKKEIVQKVRNNIAHPEQPQLTTSPESSGKVDNSPRQQGTDGHKPPGAKTKEEATSNFLQKGHEQPKSPPGNESQDATADTRLLQPYLQIVRQKINSCKKYPLLARRKQQEGRVGVRFLLTETGEVQKLTVSRNSGLQMLDQAALKAVQDSTPFPPAPPGLFSAPILIELDIMFTLS